LGLRWRGGREGTLALQVHQSDGGWTPWTQVPVYSDDAPDLGSREGRAGWRASDPVWAGNADGVRYAMATRDRAREVRLHFVRSKPAGRPYGLRARLRTAIAGAASSLSSVLGGKASADVAPPDIVTRAEWGAAACPPRATPSYGEVRLAFIHHTVSATNYGPEDSAAMVLGICRYHRNSNGWNDIGYQFLVDKYGQVFEGRGGGMDQSVVGAQSQGYNSVSTGVANLGTFSTQAQTPAGLQGIASLLSWKLSLHGVPPTGTVAVRSTGGSLNRYPAGRMVSLQRISGHRDADATSCPGDALYAQLPLIRSMVRPESRASAAVTLRAAATRVSYGRRARLFGSLRAADGAALPGRRVRIVTRRATGAGTVASVSTSDSGSFSSAVSVPFNGSFEAQFAGDAGHGSARSVPVTIGVRARVSLRLVAPPGGRLAPGGRVVVRGGVKPRKRYVLLLIDRQQRGRGWRRAAKRALRSRRGRVVGSRRLRRPGVYRVRLGLNRDAYTLGARSRPVLLIVR
jgi:hypothetical protein